MHMSYCIELITSSVEVNFADCLIDFLKITMITKIGNAWKKQRSVPHNIKALISHKHAYLCGSSDTFSYFS